jgi:hypothetical protein
VGSTNLKNDIEILEISINRPACRLVDFIDLEKYNILKDI